MDTKAASVLGICIVIAALIVALVPRAQPAPVSGPAGTEVGRYQFVRSNGVSFVVDTKTGRLWQRFLDQQTPKDWSELKTPWVEATAK
jgi:hypothetical protein